MSIPDAVVRKGLRTILLEAMQFVDNEPLPFEYTDSEVGGAFAFLKKGKFGEDPVATPETQQVYAMVYVSVVETESVYEARLEGLRALLGAH